MAVFGQMMYGIMSIMNIPFTIWGHTLSMWKVFGFSFISIVMSRVIWEIIDNE